MIDGIPALGPIEINDMDPGGPLVGPDPSLSDRIRSHRFGLVVIPLVEAHTSPPQQINGRNHIHRNFLQIECV